MKSKDILAELLNRNPAWTRARMARSLGLTPQSMNSRLHAGRTVKLEFLIQAVALLGYDVVAVPKGSRLPSGSYVIDDKKDEE